MSSSCKKCTFSQFRHQNNMLKEEILRKELNTCNGVVPSSFNFISYYSPIVSATCSLQRPLILKISQFFIIIIAFILLLQPNLVSSQTTSPHRISNFPHFSDGTFPTDLKIYTGYLQLKNKGNHEDRRRLFYWFVESQKKDAPLVIFSNGGPGCASTISFFEGIGPVRLKSQIEIVLNPNSWHKEFNLLFIDHPAGAGLSQIKKLKGYKEKEAYASSSKEAMLDYVDALNQFLNISQFDDLIDRDTYFAGESYAGKYIPWLLHLYDTTRNTKDRIRLKVKGVMLGNASLQPYIQYGTLSRHARALGITSYSQFVDLKSKLEICRRDMKTHAFDSKADSSCSEMVQSVLNHGGGLSPYDVRKTRDQQSYRLNLAHYFNNLHADLSKLGIEQFSTNNTDYYRFHRCVGDIRHNFINELYAGLPDEVFNTLLNKEEYYVLFFSGIYDLRVDTLGTQEFLRIYPWLHREKFAAQLPVQFILSGDSKPKGHFKNEGRVSFFSIYGGTHHTAQYEPETYFEMAKRFINHQTLCPTEHDCRSHDHFLCPNECSGSKAGKCEGLVCNCKPGYDGVDCSLARMELVPKKLFEAKISGEDALLYEFSFTPRTSKINLHLNLQRTSLAGNPYIMVNVTQAGDVVSLFQQKNYFLTQMNFNRNGVSSQETGFQFSNTTHADTKQIILNNLKVTPSKPHLITVGIFNDDPSICDFKFSVDLTPATSHIPLVWIYLTVIIGLVAVIVLQIWTIVSRARSSSLRFSNKEPDYNYQKLENVDNDIMEQFQLESDDQISTDEENCTDDIQERNVTIRNSNETEQI